MCDRYSCILYLIPTQFALITLNFLTLDFSKQNDVGCKLSNDITLSQCHNRMQRFREQKHQRNDQSVPRRFMYITSCKQYRAHFKYFKFKPMFKQHVNLLIRTWIFVYLTMGLNSYTNWYLCKNKYASWYVCNQPDPSNEQLKHGQ